jgi:hypothetical protein
MRRPLFHSDRVYCPFKALTTRPQCPECAVARTDVLFSTMQSLFPLAQALLSLSSVACSWAAVHMPYSLKLFTLNLLLCSSRGDRIEKEENSHGGKEQDDAQDLASTSRPRCKRRVLCAQTGSQPPRTSRLDFSGTPKVAPVGAGLVSATTCAESVMC